MYFDNIHLGDHTLVATFKVNISNAAMPGMETQPVIACGDGSPGPGGAEDVVRARVLVV
jgi:hypothetical protein